MPRDAVHGSAVHKKIKLELKKDTASAEYKML